MEPQILLKNNQTKVKIGHLGIKKTALKIIKRLNYNNSELSILIVSDSEMKELNYKYRNKNKSTDVLSFSQSSFNNSYPEIIYNNKTPPVPLGDVVISATDALSQAKEKGHSLKQEFQILLIHAILQLTGYQHENAPIEDALKMKEKEIELINYLSEL